MNFILFKTLEFLGLAKEVFTYDDHIEAYNIHKTEEEFNVKHNGDGTYTMRSPYNESYSNGTGWTTWSEI
jgi:hypothetical protein